ncbi:MAG: ribonuclease H-like domain-containing protein [Peptostreptococcaceae bacterium]
MEIITKVLDEYIDIPPNSFVFDIETTGLSPKFCKVILVGILFNHNNQTIIKQFFAKSEGDEYELLLSFIDEVKTFEKHITFNGTTFDIPFLNARFINHNIDYKLDSNDDIDILKFIKPFKKKLSLPDCKLKTVEKYLGIHRDDTISGKESVKLYKEYETNQCCNLKNIILLHNYEDIYYLGKIYKIKSVLKDRLDTLTINTDNINVTLVPLHFKFQNNKIHMKYNILSESCVPINIYNDRYTIVSENDYLGLDICISKGHDSNNNVVLFYKMAKIIPLKFNDDFLEDNIYTLCNYLIKKELKSL